MDDITPQHLSSMLQITRKFDGSIISPIVGDINFMHCNINHLTNKLHCVSSMLLAIQEFYNVTPFNFSTYRLIGYHETHSVRISDAGGISKFVHESICGILPRVLLDVVTPGHNQFLILELPSYQQIPPLLFHTDALIFVWLTSTNFWRI